MQVMVQGLLLQLWAPLGFLGGLYRRLRKVLVDVEALAAILALQTVLPEGTRVLPSSAAATLPQPSPDPPPGSTDTLPDAPSCR